MASNALIMLIVSDSTVSALMRCCRALSASGAPSPFCSHKEQFETRDGSQEADCDFNEIFLIKIASDVIKGAAVTEEEQHFDANI